MYVKSWDGCCWGGGGRRVEVCVMGICGVESGRVCCIRSRV